MKAKLSTLLTAFIIIALGVAGCTQGGTKKEGKKVNYPTRQIEYVVPFSAGGGVDLTARAVAEYVSKEWGQPVTVVNKPGGGGATGAQYALKQAPNDGYTVLGTNVSNTSMLTGGFLEPAVKLEDHRLVARIVQDAPVFVVKADAPWKDFKEFSEWVKQNPGQLTWTSVGPAGFSAFVVAEWLGELKVDYSRTKMVTTKGASESLPIVAGGNAVLAVHTVNEVYPLVKAGKLKVLAIESKTRSPFLPDVPTAEEQGIKNLTASWWTGISVPKGTPDDVVAKWEETLTKMSNDPAFIEKLKLIQMEPAFLPSKEFEAFLQKETDYYMDLATKRGMRK